MNLFKFKHHLPACLILAAEFTIVIDAVFTDTSVGWVDKMAELETAGRARYHFRCECMPPSSYLGAVLAKTQTLFVGGSAANCNNLDNLPHFVYHSQSFRLVLKLHLIAPALC